MGLVIAEGLGGGGPDPVVWAATTPPATATSAPTAAAAEPTSAPTETIAPTGAPTATRAPTTRATASAPTSAPTRSPTAAATATAEAAFVEYTVQSGDVLATIARRFGVTVEEILAVNTIANPRSLVVGDVIRIPAPSSTSDFIEYAVQPGDILVTIARRFGVTVEEILAVNTISNPDGLVVGQVIRIPQR
jgi:LysM repeat protein